MKREEVMELRGDSPRDAEDLYNHIDKNKLKDHYLAYIPKLDL
jgi:integrase/recombinase XerD